ncbi:MAG TPA: hypothetical protein PKD53_28375 [Chloroflexaceae bacterium]|nr:hypothetical protein [Chloroflexaceae bacterium]
MYGKLFAGLLALALAIFVGAGTAAAAPAARGGFGGGRGVGGHGLAQATATVTGLTLDQVRAELQAGKSLAEVAQDNGHTADEVVAGARAAYQARLDQAVAAGRLTRAQADAALQRFDADAPAMMTTAGGARGACDPAGGGQGAGRGGRGAGGRP